MNEKEILRLFRNYIQSYLLRINGSSENIEVLFDHSKHKDERNIYPLYFLWLLPEYREWYKQNNKQSYIYLGIDFIKHMCDIPIYNSYWTGILLNYMNSIVKDSGDSTLVSKYRENLSDRAYKILNGCQKFMWSFIASYLENNKQTTLED